MDGGRGRHAPGEARTRPRRTGSVSAAPSATADGGCYTVTVEVGSWLDDGWGRDHAARASSPCLVAPKGKATRRNSQANGPQPDRALNAPHAARGQGDRASRRTRQPCHPVLFSIQPSVVS